MIKQFKNERGGSLVIVLMVMLVFTVMGMGLLGMTVNSAKQVGGTNESIQTTNLAEMGVDRVESEIKQILSENPAATLTQSIAALQNGISSGDIQPDAENPNAVFSVSTPQIQGVNLVNKTGAKVGERIVVTFMSDGTKGQERTQDIETAITITRMGGVNPIYGTSEQVELIKNTQTYKTTKTFNNAFVHYQKNLLLNPPTSLTYNHNLIVDGSITMNANTEIIVKKDAHLKSELDVKTNKPGNGNLGNLCVEGTLHYYGDPDTIDVETSFTSCDSVSKKNGIFAKNIQFHTNSDTAALVWNVNDMMTQTSYE